ncbi:MAG: alanine--tRNA ligase, partial [Sinomicrobium sp.]|nr:alanine--tRNA ligase [Sinomicrobium sp.]
DKEAYDIWKSVLPEDRIIPGNKKDNFWEMGDTGPCGPCSEIHADIRPESEKVKIPGNRLVNTGHPEVVEIWNLVFITFNRKADGSLEQLPSQHVDTGMGFERLCMVMQGTRSNYDTDVFTPLIREIETMTRSGYGSDKKKDIAIRVVADHLRAVAFAIADGQLPSNTGAGYVIRRILRRAIRYGFTFLNQREPFIYKLVTVLEQQLHQFFPEISAQKNLAENVIREEEQSFLRTLDQGLILLENMIAASKDKTIPGAKAFELYDTYGFPIDLTALILRERGYTLDENAFNEALRKQRERSRSAAKTATGDWVILSEDDEEEFIGYDTLEARVKLVRYRKTENKKDGILYQLIFNLTPFYPEGGGQVGDKGYLETPEGDVIYIVDTKKENNVIVHLARELPKNTHGHFRAVVDAKQRNMAAANHSATHLLHQALRTVLGPHVEQKGSMVHSGYLRFDFSHFGKVSHEELKQIENFVNARIREQLPLAEQRNATYKKALEAGAIALFGEKYGDTVRTVRFGESIELCGGTHVKNTSEIWHFMITSESAVAAGVRRIEAITGDAAKNHFTGQSETFNELKALLKNPKEPVKAVKAVQDENAALKKQVENLLKDKTKYLEAALKKDIREINGLRFLAAETDLDQNSLKSIAFSLGGSYEDLFAVLAARHEEKALLACYISKGLVEKRGYDAGKVVRELGKYIGGGGGGQAFFATAGGKDTGGIPEALKQAETYIK